jgi:hypothetical protein
MIKRCIAEFENQYYKMKKIRNFRDIFTTLDWLVHIVFLLNILDALHPSMLNVEEFIFQPI